MVLGLRLKNDISTLLLQDQGQEDLGTLMHPIFHQYLRLGYPYNLSIDVPV